MTAAKRIGERDVSQTALCRSRRARRSRHTAPRGCGEPAGRRWSVALGSGTCQIGAQVRARSPYDLAMQQFLERRRVTTAAAWDLHDGVVLVAAGDEIPVPGRGDRTYPFRAHSEYLYLTDRERPGGVLGFDPGEGWVEFVAPVTATELLWTGLEGDSEGVPEGTRPLDELEAFVSGRPARRLGVTPEPDAELRDALIRVRRPKDDVELERMRAAAQATRDGFAELVPMIEPGRSERELQVALEAAFLRNGGDFLAFETIVAAGDHAAVLHFAPTARAPRRRVAPRRRGRRVSRLCQRCHTNVRGGGCLGARADARLRDSAAGR
jgi:hypothetical protein